MNDRRARLTEFAVNAVLIIVLFLLRYTGLMTLEIGKAVPVILIPLCLSIAIFYTENAGIFAGLLAGVLMDSVANESSVFNTLFLVIGCTACQLLATRLLNRNFKAALCLSFGFSFAYFILKHFIFTSFKGISVNYEYFVAYLIPSAVYTAVLFIPFYFFQKYLISRIERRY